jgi:predicted acylesterase/phospholipase RssA
MMGDCSLIAFESTVVACDPREFFELLQESVVEDPSPSLPASESLNLLRGASRVGYVFSGGSSRCAFQVGVIETLAELGIRPALAVGVSAGAWNAAIVAARIEGRARYYWRSFFRMPRLDLRKLLTEHSPWRYREMHARNFARFVGDRLRRPDALPLYISVTRLRDRRGVVLSIDDVDDAFELLLATNYLPPFYTHPPRIAGEPYGDGGISDNAPYEKAFSEGCDAVVLMTMKGESEGGIYKNGHEIDHVIPAALRSRVVVIRPRHRLPVSFTEGRWSVLSQIMEVGRLRAREVLLGERHVQTDLRAEGMSPSLRLARLLRGVRRR